MSIQAKPDNSAKRVLVVDDNMMSRKVILFRLEKMGLGTASAASGEEALSIIETDPVDLIFLDLIMDGMGGMDVLHAVKDDARFRDIPVVIVSGVEGADAVDDCLNAGASDFLHKPVKAAAIEEVLGDLLGVTSGADGAGATPVMPDPVDLPVFDPAFIAQLTSDYGPETVAGFVARFENLAPGQRDAVVSGKDDFQARRRAASGLKGGARTLGLTRLAGACREIERACDRRDGPGTEAAVEALGGSLDEALRALRDHRSA